MIKDFAAPNALGDLEGDANVCQKEPCPDGSGELPGLRAALRGGRERLHAAASGRSC